METRLEHIENSWLSTGFILPESIQYLINVAKAAINVVEKSKSKHESEDEVIAELVFAIKYLDRELGRIK